MVKLFQNPLGDGDRMTFSREGDSRITSLDKDLET